MEEVRGEQVERRSISQLLWFLCFLCRETKRVEEVRRGEQVEGRSI